MRQIDGTQNYIEGPEELAEVAKLFPYIRKMVGRSARNENAVLANVIREYEQEMADRMTDEMTKQYIEEQLDAVQDWDQYAKQHVKELKAAAKEMGYPSYKGATKEQKEQIKKRVL